MERAEKKAIVGIIFGFSSSAAFWLYPYPMPDDVRRPLFWTSIVVFLISTAVLVESYIPANRRGATRFGLLGVVLILCFFGVSVANFYRPVEHTLESETLLPQNPSDAPLFRPPATPPQEHFAVVSALPKPVIPWSPALHEPVVGNYTRRSVGYFFDVLQRFNSIQARQLMASDLGKRLVVSGPISTTSAISTTVLVGLGMPPNMVTCEFDRPFTDALIEYQVGDTITIDGVISGGLVSADGLFLTHCRLAASHQ